MYKKKFSRESVDTMASDPCILVNGNFFIWTLTNTMFMFCRYKMKLKKKEINNEDKRPKDEDHIR